MVNIRTYIVGSGGLWTVGSVATGSAWIFWSHCSIVGGSSDCIPYWSINAKWKK